MKMMATQFLLYICLGADPMSTDRLDGLSYSGVRTKQIELAKGRAEN